MGLRYFPAARDDIKNALFWSRENFGEATAKRYQKLISTAIAEIHANPELDYSYEVRGLQNGIRLYHLKFSRERAVVDGKTVKSPRHFVAYTIREGDTVIVRLLHERMQLTQQLKDTL